MHEQLPLPVFHFLPCALTSWSFPFAVSPLPHINRIQEGPGLGVNTEVQDGGGGPAGPGCSQGPGSTHSSRLPAAAPP